MMNQLKKLWRDESGVSAIEYALIASGVALAILTIVTDLGDAIDSKLQEVVVALGGTVTEP